MTELVESLISHANSLHEQCTHATGVARDAQIDAINKLRELGLILLELKERTPHGQFLLLFPKNNNESNPNQRFAFSARWAQETMRIARAHPTPFYSLEEAKPYLRNVGQEEETPKRIQSRSTLSWLDHFTDAAMKLTGFINGQEEKAGTPIEQWPVDQRAATKAQLEPLIVIYNRL